MSGKPKPVPEKYCVRCGQRLYRKRYNGTLEDRTRFLKRKYCSLRCANLRGIRSKKSGPQHRISQKFRKPQCESCGKVPVKSQHLHTHHINGDSMDHRKENLQTLCVGCHLKLHTKPAARCKVCGEKARKHQMCQKHFQRWKKYGDPLLIKICTGQRKWEIAKVGAME